MDPNATLQIIRESWMESDSKAMREAISDLRDWLDKGGFMPDVDADTFQILLAVIEENPN